MTLSFERGFRRLGWVLIALVAVFSGLFAYEESTVVIGYEPLQLETGFPELDATYSATRPVLVDDLGIVHVPLGTSSTDADKVIQQHFTKASNPEAFAVPLGRRSIATFAASVRRKYPEYDALDDTTLTKRVITRYPVYRDQVAFREYMLREKRAKRPFWSIGVAAAVALGAFVLIQGGISVAAWVFRGFRNAA